MSVVGDEKSHVPAAKVPEERCVSQQSLVEGGAAMGFCQTCCCVFSLQSGTQSIGLFCFVSNLKIYTVCSLVQSLVQTSMFDV